MFINKKIRIKSPRQMTWVQDGQSPQPYFEQTWPEVEESVLLILNDVKNSTHLSYQSLYSKVYQMCISQMSKSVYQALGDAVVSYLESSPKNTQFNDLQDFYDFWLSFTEKSKILSSFFLYLDRVYSTGISIPQCYDMCLLKFRDCVVLKHIEFLKLESVNHIETIRNIRFQGSFDEDSSNSVRTLEVLLHDSFEVLQLLDLFGNTTVFSFHLEPFILDTSAKYYKDIVKSRTSNMGSLDYIDSIGHYMDIEKSIDEKLSSDTDFQIKIEKIMERIFVTDNRTYFVTSTFKPFLRSKQYDGVIKTMELFSKDEDNMKYLMEVFANECAEAFVAIVEDPTLPRKKQQVKWIQNFLDLSKDYTVLVENITIMKTQMLSYINEGVSKALNKDSKKSADYLSQFLDFYLRSETCWDKSLENMGMFDKIITKCVRLLQIIEEKDMFELFHKQHLSKRLLQRRSNLDCEKHLVMKMKDSLGSNFTSKMENMIYDVVSSIKNNKKFNNTGIYFHPFELEASILTNTCWPFQNAQINNKPYLGGNNDDLVEDEVILPSILKKYSLDFENFYIKTHEGRKVTWAHPYGFLDIGYQFKETYHVINMPFYAGVIFLLFEDYHELTTRQIKSMTRIPSNEIIRNLASMSLNPKTRILNKTPFTKSIKDSDVFSINEFFTAPEENVKMILASIVSKSSSTKNQVSNEISKKSNEQLLDSKVNSSVQVVEDESLVDKEELQNTRRWKTITTIARVLKEHKTLKTSVVKSKVVEQPEINFSLDDDIFQNALDHLLEKEYISLSDGDTLLYIP